MSVVIAKVRVFADAPWVEPFQKMVDEFHPGGARMIAVLQRTMILGILKAVRAKFFANMHHALQTTIEGKDKQPRVGKLIDANKQVAMLKSAYRSFDAAVLSGKRAKIRAAQRQVQAAQRRIIARYAEDGGGKLTEHRNLIESRLRLGVLTGQLMRGRILTVMQALTASTNLSPPTIYRNATVVGAGSERYLNMIDTPSATVALTGVRSKSRYKTLWRHLEFGSGIDAKPQPGGFVPPKTPWFYGRPGEGGPGGLKIIGTKPMSFLWTDKGAPATPAVGTVIQEAFEEAMLKFIPNLK